MDRYGKYFLQHILWLDDGFNEYYVQDKAWGRQEILDVESVVFDWPEQTEQWLQQCAQYEDYDTHHRLRVFLADESAEPLHRMNDRQVLRAAARQITHGFFQIVIKPRLGWAVKLDAQTQKPALPIAVEPAPDIKGMLSQLKVDLDGMVAEQKRQYDKYEAKLATMDDAEKALLYSKKGGKGLFNATIGSAIDLVKSLPGLAKKAAGVWWKFNNLPLRLAKSTADAIRAGSWGPLKREVHQIAGPVVQSAEQLKQITSMVAVLLSEQVTRDMLLNFVDRYWENTHPLEKTEMGAEAASEVVMTILLAIFTAGVGAAANLAAKSGRLVKVAKLLQKIAAALKRVRTFRKMPKKQKGGGLLGFFKKNKPKKKGVPEPRSPKKKAKAKKDKAAAKRAQDQKLSEDIDSKKIADNSRTNEACVSGHPVDAITGEVIDALDDFSITGRLPLVWQRFYASQKDTDGACGHNWQCPADIRLVVDEDRNVIFHDGTPDAAVFKGLPVDIPIIEAANGAVLERDNGRLTVRQKSGLCYSFIDPGTSFDRLPLDQLTDTNGNYLKFKRQGANLTEIADNQGPVVKVSSRNGRILQMDAVKPDGTLAPLVKYEYSNGELVAAIDALGKAHRFEYAEGKLTKTTNRNGVGFCYEYDDHTPSRCVRTYGPDGLYDYRFTYKDNETHCTDSLGNDFVLQFDDNNLLTAKIDKNGDKIQWEYDKACRITAVIDQVGKKTGYRYDPAGNLICVTRPDGKTVQIKYDRKNKPVAITDAKGKIWRQQYSDLGLLIKQISPAGAVTQYDYNKQGDLVGVTDPRGGQTRFDNNENGHLTGVTDPLGNHTTIKVDHFGNVTSLIDPAGEKTSYTYDTKHRLLNIVRPSNAVVQCEYDDEDNLILYKDEAGHKTRLEYTGLNEMSGRHNPDGTSLAYEYDTEEKLIRITNERGQSLSFVRDHQGRVIEEIDYWGNSRKYTYDPAGTLLESIDPLGRITRYGFDPLNRLIAKTLDSGDSETFDYDENGNLVENTNNHSTVKRTFDDDNRLINETSGEVTVTNTYDIAGNRTKRTSSHGNEVAFDYDLSGSVTGIAINGHAPIQIDRDSRGQAVKEVLNEQIQRRYEYNNQGYLTNQQIDLGSSEIKRTYEYDPTGNLITRKDNTKGDSYFSYDPRGRIAKYINPEGLTKQLLYDEAGDLLKQRSHEALQLRTMVHEDSTYQFDAAGNLVHRKDKNSDFHYNWDGNNRLIHAEGTDGTTAHMVYDAQGRRIAKHTQQGTTTFAWDGDCILSDQKQNHGPREFVFYPGTFEPLAAIDADKSIYYFHNDHIGAPQEVTDSQGNIVWSAGYDATGGIEKLFVNKFDNPIRLQGQYADDELGLYYNRYRYFDPRIGAFISQDPLRIAAGVNLYAFSPNVWGWVDPLGLACENASKRKGKSEKFERYGNKTEAEISEATNKLPLKPGHEKQPKWIADDGVVDPRTLGKRKNYTHKIKMEAAPKTKEWLKQFEIKTNEPNRYAIPADRLDEFNSRVRKITIKKR